MQECYQLGLPGQAPVVKKGHIEPIDISVASRGSNKKVRPYLKLSAVDFSASLESCALILQVLFVYILIMTEYQR